MVKRSSMRASDADRDRVAERLHQAATEGRLTPLEMEERLARALRATTYGDLDPLVADLPGPGASESARGASRGSYGRSSGALRTARRNPALAVVVALMAAWVIPTLFALVIAAVAIAATAVLTVVAFVPLALLLMSRGGRGSIGGRYRQFGVGRGSGYARHSSYARNSTHARRTGRF